ncbi:MAG: hypothetical protein J3K34DRAFT_526938 [Monoraphidium minutum]|nr:MAG: hypothetical protein J3K34DRAFT_526938 [Monoraphidium minutum]
MARRTPAAPRALAAALVFCAAALLRPAAAQPAAGPDISAVPEACINAGAELQGTCQEEFNSADAYFSEQGASFAAADPAAPVNITQEQIDGYIAQAPPPSPECCAAAQAFNDDFCSCNPAVLDLAIQFTAGNPNIYRSVAAGFANACGFPAFIADTCPPPGGAAAAAPGAAAAPAAPAPAAPAAAPVAP